jgi:hypothetical protein
MRQLGIIPRGRILIIEAKDEQIRTNKFFVLQLQKVCGRGFPVVGKPFTTVLVPPSFLEWSDTGVDENLTPPCGSSDRKRSPAARLVWEEPMG